MSGRRLHPISALRAFLSSEAGGGVLLLVAAGLALGIANSPLSAAYFAALDAHVGPLEVRHWINDGLMALFFLLVGSRSSASSCRASCPRLPAAFSPASRLPAAWRCRRWCSWH